MLTVKYDVFLGLFVRAIDVGVCDVDIAFAIATVGSVMGAGRVLLSDPRRSTPPTADWQPRPHSGYADAGAIGSENQESKSI